MPVEGAIHLRSHSVPSIEKTEKQSPMRCFELFWVKRVRFNISNSLMVLWQYAHEN